MNISELEAVFVYTDSTGFPRSNEVSLAQTWPILLSESAVPSMIRGGGGYTSRDILRNIQDDAFYFSFDRKVENGKSLVILFFGIVDSAPRPITYKLKIISQVPVIGGRIWGRFSKVVLQPIRPIIQKIWRYQLVSPANFRKNLNQMCKIFEQSDIKVLLCENPIPSSYVNIRSPGFDKSVQKYNLIKREVANQFSNVILVEFEKNFEPEYVSKKDGHHFSALDHEYIRSRIRDSLEQL
jgi:hypothetical protein